jgi:hypothetical protein
MGSKQNVPTSTKTWFIASLFGFLLAALAGLLLRYAFVVEVPIDYMNIRHAHGHMAMLGWVYPALFALIGHFFLSEKDLKGKKYRGLFWSGFLSALAMFVAFIVQGYGAYSLGFLTLHFLFFYAFCYHLWKDTHSSNGHSVTLLRAGILYGILATLGTWSMFILKELGMGNSVGYHMSSQVFLHFQLTGWFTFAALAIFFKQLEDRGAKAPSRTFRFFFWSLNLATVLTYALAVAWLSSHPLSYLVNGIGVLIQLAALIAFLSMLREMKEDLKEFPFSVRLLYVAALSAFILKVLFQSGLVVPHVAKMAHTIQHLVIGFIHLNVLGIISSFLLGSALSSGHLRITRTSMVTAYVFLLGVFLSELILFLQGLFFWMEIGFLPFYYRAIFYGSVFLPLGILLFLFGGIGKGKRVQEE